jgi:hypothetical protein
MVRGFERVGDSTIIIYIGTFGLDGDAFENAGRGLVSGWTTGTRCVPSACIANDSARQFFSPPFWFFPYRCCYAHVFIIVYIFPGLRDLLRFTHYLQDMSSLVSHGSVLPWTDVVPVAKGGLRGGGRLGRSIMLSPSVARIPPSSWLVSDGAFCARTALRAHRALLLVWLDLFLYVPARFMPAPFWDGVVLFNAVWLLPHDAARLLRCHRCYRSVLRFRESFMRNFYRQRCASSFAAQTYF